MSKVYVQSRDGTIHLMEAPVAILPLEDLPPPTPPEVPPVSGTIVFPHPEIAEDRTINRDFYLGGKTPWNEPCVLTSATNDVVIHTEPVAALTMPFDGDMQYRAHQSSIEKLFAGDIDGAKAAITSTGISVKPIVNGVDKDMFYIARDPLTTSPTIAGMIYAQSMVEPMHSDGKRNFVYYLLAENAMSDHDNENPLANENSDAIMLKSSGVIFLLASLGAAQGCASHFYCDKIVDLLENQMIDRQVYDDWAVTVQYQTTGKLSQQCKVSVRGSGYIGKHDTLETRPKYFNEVLK